MSGSIEIVTGNDIVNKWGIEPADLFYIILNHGLDVSDQFGYTIGWDDVLRGYGKGQDFTGLLDALFLVKDFDRIDKTFGQNIPERKDLISGMQLCDKWGRPENYLVALIIGNKLNAIDRLGKPFDLWPLVEMGFYNLFSAVLFRLKDVELFEKEHPEIVSNAPTGESPNIKKSSEILLENEDSHPLDKEDNSSTQTDSIPAISFYKNGQKWKIGIKGKERDFNHYDGFEYIKFLLRYPEERFNALTVFNLGNVPDEVKYQQYERSIKKTGDKKTIQQFLEAKNEIEMKLETTFDPNVERDLKGKLEKINEYLKRAEKVQGIEKTRQNLTHRIDDAIQAIEIESKNSKELKTVLQHLSRKNPEKRIFTGAYSCRYVPDPDFPIVWLLDPPL